MLNERDLTKAIQEQAQSAYLVYGEISRDGDRTIALLARDTASQALVILCVTPERKADGSYELSVDSLTELDYRLPASEAFCPKCGAKLRAWARFCGACGNDVSGRTATTGTNIAELRAGVEQALGLENELLGEMLRKEGGGPVFFSRNRASKALMALSLKRDVESGGWRMGETSVLRTAMNRDAFDIVQPMPRMATPHSGGSPAIGSDAARKPSTAMHVGRIDDTLFGKPVKPKAVSEPEPVTPVRRPSVPPVPPRPQSNGGEVAPARTPEASIHNGLPKPVVVGLMVAVVIAALAWAALSL